MERTCTSLELEKFKDANKNELSMIEVAHAILSQNGDVMAFADLTNKIQEFLGASDQEIRDRLAQFYTDLNVDGSFIFGAYVHGIHLIQLMRHLSIQMMMKMTTAHVRNVRELMPSWQMLQMMM